MGKPQVLIVINGKSVEVYCDDGVGLDIIEVPVLDCWTAKAEALTEEWTRQKVRYTQKHLFPGKARKVHNILDLKPSDIEQIKWELDMVKTLSSLEQSGGPHGGP
jgi:hypothetical protein